MAINANPAPQFSPSTTKVPLLTNYVDIYDYTSIYDLEKNDEIANIYGNQSVAGLLNLLQSEGTIESDKYVWTEQGRRFTIYKDVSRSNSIFTKAKHNFRVGELVTVAGNGKKSQGRVDSVTTNTFTLKSFTVAGFDALGTSNIIAFVHGSLFAKGTDGMQGSKSIEVTILDNKPAILKDMFHVNGSDMAQISWINTGSGYLWFLKDQIETRGRWEDTCEYSQMKAIKAEEGSELALEGLNNTQGVWSAIRERGNTYQGTPETIEDWDSILKRFDQQGKLADYTYYCDRDSSLAIDNMLGQLNAGYDKGISYGLFPNGRDMAVDLGFQGFTRGTYNFFKTDYKLLNDPTLEGALPVASKVRGMLIPAGSTEVYEGAYNGAGVGTKVYTPNLQTMYRANGVTNRKDQVWIIGNGFGIHTDSKDRMEQHFLSERMINTVGANNFMLMEGDA